jgi:hypothetical protein
MKRYYVQASYVVWCDAIIEADSEEEARDIAQAMDGSHFEPNGGGDWAVDCVTETEWTYV